ncbi:MAG: hypothetical protein KBD78_02420 [Oligoflexales bacterium]|nr:hypothetical protein [Oligoflexales bacterium]
MLKFSKALKLTYQETKYFESLVNFGQATSSSEKRYFQRKLKVLKSTVLEREVINPRNDSLLANWYSPAFLLCFENKNREAGITYAKQRLGLALETIVEALERFKIKGYLK